MSEDKVTEDIDPSIDLFLKTALSRKAIGLVALDVRELTSLADVFIICSGRSNRQVTAIAEFIKTEMKKHGKMPLSTDGIKEGQWALIDYGDVIIHVFHEPVREYYDLESLWIDAKKIKKDLITELTEKKALQEGSDLT